MYLNHFSIKLSPDNIDNLLNYKKKYYRIDYLKDQDKYVQGGNGIVFKLIDEQEDEEFVIKISKYSEDLRGPSKLGKRIKRFDREIEALYTAKVEELSNIVIIRFDGVIQIGNKDFRYYVMDKCDCNLNEFLQNPDNKLDVTQKILLCQKILEAIKNLNEYKIYHRDIKHDNIFFQGNEPFVGDLGLADKRDSDIIINERGELIGPTGWFSPEAINKYLVEKTLNPNNFDCEIDEKSEVFQLGKLFWYIFQGNIPLGQIEPDDFVPNNEEIFNILFNMLKYSKKKRWGSTEVLSSFEGYLAVN